MISLGDEDVGQAEEEKLVPGTRFKAKDYSV